jgi:glycosyltransferase involved in cell wall biosynthesis
MTLPSVTVIVTTYNWPAALDRVLHSLNDQDYDRLEVIIADDGSVDETANLIESWRKHFRFRLIHCWQADQGFRAAMIRNRAIALASHDYIIFIDGDCIVRPQFVYEHARLAKPGWFAAGNRILLNQNFTDNVLKLNLPIHRWSNRQWMGSRWRGECNRFMAFFTLPLGIFRKCQPLKWQGAKTCNLGAWRQDLLKVNGFDESYEGWGYEDSDCVMRLLRAKVFHQSAKYCAPVIHLWHPVAKRDQADENAKRLALTQQSSTVRALQGVEQYLAYEYR